MSANGRKQRCLSILLLGGRGKCIRRENAALNEYFVECSRLQGLIWRDCNGVYVMAGSRGRKRLAMREKRQSVLRDSCEE